MTQHVIDLRSDTVTRPSRAMRTAMAEADVGDDVYGEDPTVRKLEERVAELLGQEAALFVTSGTMGNTLAFKVLTEPGDELLMDPLAHALHFEVGAAAALCGVQIRTIPAKRGIFEPDDVSQAVKPMAYYLPRTRVLVIENTHNFGGGTVWPADALGSVASTAEIHGLRIHLDGARLFNACVASGVSAREYASHVDTVTVCLSKGLGAPVGSVLASTKVNIARARRYRKMWGGGMRQAGILAAAGIYALDNNVTRLADDHANARLLGDALANIAGLAVDVSAIATNIVLARVTKPGLTPYALLEKLRDVGVLANPTGPNELRFVTHMDVSSSDIHEAAARIMRALA